MSAAPKLDASHRKEKILLSGEIPSPLNPPSGCRFRTRCWKATQVCATTRPPLVVDPVGQGHTAEFRRIRPSQTGANAKMLSGDGLKSTYPLAAVTAGRVPDFQTVNRLPRDVERRPL